MQSQGLGFVEVVSKQDIETQAQDKFLDQISRLKKKANFGDNSDTKIAVLAAIKALHQ